MKLSAVFSLLLMQLSSDKATAEKGKRLVVQPTKVPIGEAKFCVLSVADAVIFPVKATVEPSAHAAPAFGNVYTQVERLKLVRRKQLS